MKKIKITGGHKMKDSIIDRLNLFTLGEKKENAYQKFFKGKLKE
jgi:hypothetical protein